MKNNHGIELSWYGNDWIPKVCADCSNVDYEMGEYDSIIGLPYCEKNIWFPTKKGTCIKQQLKKQKEASK